MESAAGGVRREGEPPLFTWRVAAPWRRFGRELAGGAVWFALVWAAAAWLGGPDWIPVPILVAALFVVGPLFIPMEATFEEKGVRVRTPLGGEFLPWTGIAGFTVRRGRRAAYLHRHGLIGRLRGPVTLFLPAEPEFAEAALRHLAARLPGSAPARPGGA